MAGQYRAGSVSAKIDLDTKEFDEAIKELKKQTQEINNIVNKSAETSSTAINNLISATNNLKQKQQELTGSVTTTTDKIKQEADALKALSKENRKNVQDINNTIKANNNLGKSILTIGKNWKVALKPMKEAEKQAKKTTASIQQQFSKMMYDKLWKHAGGQLIADPIKNQMKDLFSSRDIKEFEKLWEQAIKDLNISVRKVGESTELLNLGGLVKPVEQADTSVKKLTSDAKKLENELKSVEAQSQKTASSLEKDFAKSLHTILSRPENQKTGSVFFKPIYEELKQQFKSLVKNKREFDSLFSKVIPAIGSKLTPTRDPEQFVKMYLPSGDKRNFGRIATSNLKPIGKALDEITTSTEKATEATKQLEQAQLDLSGKTKYSFEEIYPHLEQLPLKYKTAYEGVIRVLALARNQLLAGAGGGFSGFINMSKKDLHFLNDLYNERKTGLDAWASQIPFLKHPAEGRVLSVELMEGALDEFLQVNEDFLKNYKKLGLNDSIKYIGESLFGRVAERDKYDISEYIAHLKNLLVAFEDIKIISRKTGDVVKDFGKSTQVSAKQTKQLTTETKKLGETTKYTATELQLLKEMYDHFVYRKDLGDTLAPFVATYKEFENKYKNLLTNLDPKFKKRIKKQFQSTFKELAHDLGVAFSPETVLLPEGSQKTVNFLGKRIGSYDLTKLIGENDFRKLIGEVEELGAVEEVTAVSTNKLGVAIKDLGTFMKGLNQLRFNKSAPIIAGLTEMAKANEQYVEGVKEITKSQRYIAELKRKGYNFGFTGKDAKDLQFIRNTLRELQTGVVHGSGRIRPRDAQIRLFSPEEIKFAEYLFDNTKRMGKSKLTAKQFFTTDMYWGDGGNFGARLVDYDDYNVDTPKLKNQTKKVAQKVMRKVFDFLGVELIEATGRGGHNFDGQRISEIDVSKLSDDWFEIRASMDKAVDTAKIIEQEENKISREELKIAQLVEIIGTKILKSNEGIVDASKLVTDLTNKFTLLNKARNAIASKSFGLGYKPNGKAMAEDLGALIVNEMRNGLKTLYINPRSRSYTKNRPEDGWDNSLMGHHSKYIEIDEILTELGTKYDHLNLSAKEFDDLISKNFKHAGLLGAMVRYTGSSASDRYFPSTSELEDLELERIKQGEKAFRGLLQQLDALTTKSTDFTNSLQKAVTQANALSIALQKAPLAKFRKNFEDNFLEADKLFPEKIVTAFDGLYRANSRRNLGTISQEQWLNEVLAWGKQIEKLDIDKFVKSYIRLGDKDFAMKHHNLLSPFTYLGTFRRTGGNKGDGQLVGDGSWWKLSDFGKADEATILKKILPLLEKAEPISRRLVNHLQTISTGISVNPSFVSSVEESITCLDDFTGGVQRAVESEKELETQSERLRPILANIYGGTPNNAIENIIGDIEKRSEEITDVALKMLGLRDNANSATKAVEQLVVAVERVGKPINVFGKTGLFSNWATVPEITTKEFLEAYVSYRNFMKEIISPVGISGYQSNVTNVFDTIRKKVEELSNAYKEMHHTIISVENSFGKGVQSFGISSYHKFIGDLKAITSNVFNDIENGVSNVEHSTKNLPVVLEEISEKAKQSGNDMSDSFNRAREESEKFYEETQRRDEEFYRKQRENAKRYREEQKRRYYNENFGMGDFSFKNTKNMFQQLNAIDKRLEELYGRKFNSRFLRMPQMSGEYNVVSFGKYLAHTTTALKTFDNSVLQTAHDIHNSLYKAMKSIFENNKLLDEPLALPLKNWREALSEIKAFETRYEQLMRRMYTLSRGMGRYINDGKKNTGYGAILEQLYPNQSFTDKDLRKITFSPFSQEGSLGRINVEGYSDYIARINEIKQALSGAGTTTNQYKEQLISLANALKSASLETNRFATESNKAIEAMTKMAVANENFDLNKRLGSQLNNLKSQIREISKIQPTAMGKGFSEFNSQLTILGNRLTNVGNKFREGKISEEQYAMELDKIRSKLSPLHTEIQTLTRDLQQQRGVFKPEEIDKTTNAIKRGTDSLRTYGQAMKQDEAYLNNLYRGLQKARSIIISLKTIGRMFGGMAIWNWVFELVESAKQTYVAKNEIQSLLEKNAKVDAGGIKYFNYQLDKTVDRFQKINKYSLGETASSIGLEFNLNAKEMGKALPIIAMIQSEYVRAGRTVEEASLAVKDILQGEFMRLSRETGVGKKDLMEKYGWNGDNTDVLNLMEALEKAGKERHWDLFAEKATSLNDVLTITQSRFSEFGAEVATVLEPAIVGSFNVIIGVIDGLKNAFGSLSSGGQIFAIGTAGLTGLVTASSLYLTIAKNIGLADIATMGWAKSMASAMLQLNKFDVVQHGFLKTLMANLSGTKASEVASIGLTRTLGARLLGVKANTVAEQGFFKALVESRMALKGQSMVMDFSSLSAMNFRQKLTYLIGNISLADARTAGWGKTIKAIITSTKLLKLAILGITSLGLIGIIASFADWCDTVRRKLDVFNNMLENGQERYESSKKTVEEYKKKLGELTAGTEEYQKVHANLKTAIANRDDIYRAKELAKFYDERNKKMEEYNQLGFQNARNNVLAQHGMDIEKKGAWEYQTEQAEQYKITAMNAGKAFAYASLQHANEHAQFIKDYDQRIDYIMEYTTVAEQASTHLKEFMEGNLQSGLYFLLDELHLKWVDLWNDSHFEAFWASVQDTWRDLKPTIDALKDSLGDFGHMLLDFFTTKEGQIVGGIAVVGGAIAGLGIKFYHVLGGAKSTIDILKTLGGKVKNMGKSWKEAGDKAEEATEKMGGTKSTGGITGDVESPKSINLKTELIEGFKGNVVRYANYATQLAFMMGLITEAIYLIQAPMWALAETGKTFKAKEKSIRAGIDGLKLIAPTIIAVLVPVMALVKVMDMWGDKIMNWKTLGATVVGIVVGLGLVTEAIIMLKAPMWALSEIGKDFSKSKLNIQNGIDAMNTLGNALRYLAPFIPVFIGGIALMALAIAQPEIGILAIVGVAGGIALGMVYLTEAIVSLRLPLEGISQLGSSITDLDGVKKGAEAIKLTAEALGYVESAVSSLAGITWSDLSDNIAHVIANYTGINLKDLTGEDGFLSQLNGFMKDLNDIEIVSPKEEKITALANVSQGINAITEAMKSVRQAMENLPSEFKNGSTNLSYDMGTDTTSVGKTADVQGYFDTFKEPLEQLDSFIKYFNSDALEFSEPIDSEKLSAISSSADMITQVDTAVQKVKSVMQGIGDSQWNTAYAEGGILTAIGGSLFHMSGVGTINNGQASGDYKSSLGGSLKEMEDVISDLFTFQNNISSITGGGSDESGNVDGVTGMVTAIESAIESLATSLANSIPTFESKGNAMSSAIIKGFKEGLSSESFESIVKNKISSATESLNTSAKTLGTGMAKSFNDGINPMSSYTWKELEYVGVAIDENKEGLGEKAYNLADYMSGRYKDGLDMNSPGLMARTTQTELGYIGDYLQGGIDSLPSKAFELANALTSNFKLDFGLGGLQLPDMTQFQTQIGTLLPMVDTVKSQVSNGFNTMKQNVGTALTGVATDATTKYGQIVGTTRTSLTNMQTQTTKNISAIRTSWKGMQTALIASAENIRQQTGSKISNLKSNMADFWKKIQNPSLLISGSAGGPTTGTVRRRYGNSNHIRRGAYAGGTNSPAKMPNLSRDIKEYLECILTTGGNCYAGGWNFNWNHPIQSKFNGWNTHFGKYKIDDYVKVGKFHNNNFPVKGIAEIAKQYIYDTIASTKYDLYYNSHFGEDPVSALRAGAFNCWDGTNIVLALANAFGFGGGYRGSGTWSGTGHVWAVIPGLGIIDPTAIQGGYGFKSPKVKGYSAGGTIKRGSSGGDLPNGETNYNTNIEIHVHGDDVSVNDKKIDDNTGRKIIDLLGINPSTGR